LGVLGGLVGGQFIGSIPLAVVIVVKQVTSGGNLVFNSSNISDLSALGISHNLGLILMMIPAATSLILTVVLIQWLHKRSFAETVNGTKKVRFGRIGIGALVWTILLALYLLIDYQLDPENYILQFDLGNFIVLTIISFVFIPLQTTSEEILFRGYLTQGLAAWTKNRWLAFILPGVIFGLIHFANPEVKEFGFWLAMPQYIFLGLLFGFIAVLDDGIELPMGMHAANNIFLSLFTTHASSVLQTDAVFSINTMYPGKETIVLVLSGIIAVLYFAKRYKWNFRTINKKVNAITE
jgi:membrane protease YdiL (CAAX protease family)